MTHFAPLGLHRCRLIMAAVVGSWLMVDVRPVLAQSGASPLPAFDFRQASAVADWGETHDVSHIEATKQGMAVHIRWRRGSSCGSTCPANAGSA